MEKVLVTGGCGYIGSHTLIELLAAGFEPVSIDDNSRSSAAVLDGVERVTGRRVRNRRVDLRDPGQTDACFAEHRDAVAVIHFAAYKSAPESVALPLRYYDNNITSLLNALAGTERYRLPCFIFSSSCAVYGQPDRLPVTEDAPLAEPGNPYARTKQVGEHIIRDLAPRSRTGFAALRYFNAVGAHPSGEVGEVPWGEPDNIVPRLTRAAIDRLPEFVVHGDDYDTRDGTCVRDYVHVSDISRAHVLAIAYLRNLTHGGQATANPGVFNLGSGTGTTVLEAVRAVERASGRKLRCRTGPRRPGDIAAIYASSERAAAELGWRPRFDIDEIARTAWQWEQRQTGAAVRPGEAGA
ncbi:MAG: UDP-glucose 4-epimerase GalE [bacterium]